MPETVGQMTRDELKELIDASVEEKLAEILGDPDEGLELRPEIRERIIRQRQEYAAGKRGRTLEHVEERLERT
jgi:hypothetical protein